MREPSFFFVMSLTPVNTLDDERKTMSQSNSPVTLYNWLCTNKNVTLITDQGPKSINATNPFYPQIKNALSMGQRDEVLSLLDISSRVRRHCAGQFWYADDRVFAQHPLTQETVELPEVLSRRLVEMVEAGLSTDILMNFWRGLAENPNVDSQYDLYAFLDANHMPLVESNGQVGFLAYKAVRQSEVDGQLWDIYTYDRTRGQGTYSNNPGATPKMDRSQVDSDRNRTCSRGLHVAAFDYAQNHYGAWHGGNTGGVVLVEVLVRPQDVVAVPPDYNQQKMRVSQYTVLRVCEGIEYKGLVYDPNIDDREVFDEDYDPYEDVDEEMEEMEEDIHDLIEDTPQPTRPQNQRPSMRDFQEMVLGVDDQGNVVVPVKVCRKYGLHPEDEVHIYIDEDSELGTYDIVISDRALSSLINVLSMQVYVDEDGEVTVPHNVIQIAFAVNPSKRNDVTFLLSYDERHTDSLILIEN